MYVQASTLGLKVDNVVLFALRMNGGSADSAHAEGLLSELMENVQQTVHLTRDGMELNVYAVKDFSE